MIRDCPIFSGSHSFLFLSAILCTLGVLIGVCILLYMLVHINITALRALNELKCVRHSDCWSGLSPFAASAITSMWKYCHILHRSLYSIGSGCSVEVLPLHTLYSIGSGCSVEVLPLHTLYSIGSGCSVEVLPLHTLYSIGSGCSVEVQVLPLHTLYSIGSGCSVEVLPLHRSLYSIGSGCSVEVLPLHRSLYSIGSGCSVEVLPLHMRIRKRWVQCSTLICYINGSQKL